ncbi:MAG: hypothetical protein ABR915_01470 [Thermoguttaceae bacterium]|jgi:hypothetical protein
MYRDLLPKINPAAVYPAKPQAAAVLAILLGSVLSSAAWAGGGPENVLLVVNPDSPDSLAIGNYYAAIRRIPASNTVYVPWDPKAETTDVETFRKKILIPVFEAAGVTRPNRQIDYVIYSADFPWGIRLDKDVERFMKSLEKPAAGKDDQSAEKGKPEEKEKKAAWPYFLKPVGSLNGLTYLWQPVLAGHPIYFERRSNWYVRSATVPPSDGTQAFSSTVVYGPRGEPVASGGRTYMLSMMLGVTSGRGNSRQEVLDYLKRSAAADGTHPAGTIYFLENPDVRSQVRKDAFPAAVRALGDLGVRAEILPGVMPMDKDDVQGAMLGIADFDWKSSHSTILPGAICEHFTSCGGEMNTGASQTPLSEFLRYGAAAASGTVIEPYALADKFPSPMMHVHYARGSTVAEAFYQSVMCPYQLLIVGDPLCRPWADIPEVSVAGVSAGAAVQGRVRLQPSARFSSPKSEVDHFELFVDGVRVAQCPPSGTLDLDTGRLPDGYHELRVVAVQRGPIRSQGRRIVEISTANHGRTITVEALPQPAVTPHAPLVLVARAPRCLDIGVLQGPRIIAKIAGAEGRVEIKASALGAGPVRLQVVGFGSEGPQSNVFSKPLEVLVKDAKD